MYNSEALQEKWQPVLDHPDLPQITDSYKRAVTAVILENQEKEMKESRSFLTEAEMSTADAVANWDPVLISLVRRSMPNLMAYDICGVQPMSGPTGLIFAMKARMGEGATSVDEALFDEADTADSNVTLTGSQTGAEPGVLNDSGAAAAVTTDAAIPDIWGVNTAGTYNVKGADTTAAGEAYGSSGNEFQDMGFTIEKATVTARTRALRAAYTMELAQDLKAIHGLDAESELSNILSTEILAEINREIVRTIYITAKIGAQTTASAGIFILSSGPLNSLGGLSTHRLGSPESAHPESPEGHGKKQPTRLHSIGIPNPRQGYLKSPKGPQETNPAVPRPTSNSTPQ